MTALQVRVQAVSCCSPKHVSPTKCSSFLKHLFFVLKVFHDSQARFLDPNMQSCKVGPKLSHGPNTPFAQAHAPKMFSWPDTTSLYQGVGAFYFAFRTEHVLCRVLVDLYGHSDRLVPIFKISDQRTSRAIISPRLVNLHYFFRPLHIPIGLDFPISASTLYFRLFRAKLLPRRKHLDRPFFLLRKYPLPSAWPSQILRSKNVNISASKLMYPPQCCDLGPRLPNNFMFTVQFFCAQIPSPSQVLLQNSSPTYIFLFLAFL